MRPRTIRKQRRPVPRRCMFFLLLFVGLSTILSLSVVSLLEVLFDGYALQETPGLPRWRVDAPVIEERPRQEEYAQRSSKSHALPLSRLDELDPLLPRPGENFITYGAFLDCVAARLRVDRHQQRELPIRDDEPFFPYLVAPITFELRELKAFTCNVTVPIKHLMIVVNYNLSSVAEFMDATAAAFAFTDRLQIRRFPRNRGYAGAINEAMRHALTFPFDEVPFFFMANCDVRFSEGLLEEALPRINARAFAGKPLLESLRAEVVTEPNEYTPWHFRHVPLRSTDGKHLLHTSPSLPDRVRYMSKAGREAVFQGMDGWYFPNALDQTAVWGLSRLAIETVGFFDENCYPAYWEDTDYIERLKLLGLQAHSAVSRRGGLVHLGNNMFKTADTNTGATSLGDTLAFLRGMVVVLRYQLPASYTRRKRLAVNMRGDSDTGAAERLLPPDAWVLNERRRVTLMDVVRLSILHQSRELMATRRFANQNVEEFLGFLPEHERTPFLIGLATSEMIEESYHNGTALRLLSIEL